MCHAVTCERLHLALSIQQPAKNITSCHVRCHGIPEDIIRWMKTIMMTVTAVMQLCPADPIAMLLSQCGVV